MFFLSGDSRLQTLAVSFLLCAGCTHAQLRRNTVNQMATVHELQQQQVLDNLAMFVQNRYAYPYYSVVSQGTSQLSDTGTLALPTGFGRSAAAFIFNSLGINSTAQRQATEAWTINPVNDSVKLTLMRCAYQRAIEGCFGISVSACPNCEALFEDFYKPPAKGNQTEHKTERIKRDRTNTAPSPAPPPVQAPDTAPSPSQAPTPGGSGGAATDSKPVRHVDPMVTPWCLSFESCWFCWAPKLPSHIERCTPVGHYCDIYVWVPDGGRDELTKLMLLIQDIAFYDFPAAHLAMGAAPGGAAAAYFGRTPSVYPYTVLGTLQVFRASSAPSQPVAP